MNSLLQEIIDILKNMNNGFNWNALSSICSLISLIAIIVLLIERKEKKRPYLQITFELIKSSLVCVIIRNVGESPAILREVCFNAEFVKQLPQSGQEHLKNRNDLHITIYPKQQWVICLNVVSPTIFEYEHRTLDATLKYADLSKKGKAKIKYIEESHICFDDYSSFLVYVSEIDELRQSLKDVSKTIKDAGNKIAKAYSIPSEIVKTTSYANLDEKFAKTLVTEIVSDGDESN